MSNSTFSIWGARPTRLVDRKRPSSLGVLVQVCRVGDIEGCRAHEGAEGSSIGNRLPPGFVLSAVMALAKVWTAANPFGPSLDPDTQKRPAVLRQNLAEAVRLLSKSKTGGG